MADYMIFPETVEEFIEQYKFKDDKEIYTNGADLIPVFRIKQWMYHHMTPDADVVEVRHGKWREIITHNGGTPDYDCVCSVCKKSGMPTYNFCPNCDSQMEVNFVEYNYCPDCGARMDGGERNG